MVAKILSITNLSIFFLVKITPYGIWNAKQQYTSSQSVHHWSTTPQYNYQQQANEDHSAQVRNRSVACNNYVLNSDGINLWQTDRQNAKILASSLLSSLGQEFS